MSISIAQAKTLCNASELALVRACGPKEIGALSAAQVQQKLTRARKTRDKWRDQAEAQRRKSQARLGARQTKENARSVKKAQLFAEVLERFEKQLEKLGGAPASGKQPKKPTKVDRGRTHRATRAAVRDDLAETGRELSSKRKTAKRKPAQKVVKKKLAATGDAPTKVAAQGAKPKTGPTSKKKPTARRAVVKKTEPASAKKPGKETSASKPAASKLALKDLAAAQGLSTSKRQQRTATTAAKKSRIQASGNVRIQKHISALNKRNQARRDSK